MKTLKELLKDANVYQMQEISEDKLTEIEMALEEDDIETVKIAVKEICDDIRIILNECKVKIK